MESDTFKVAATRLINMAHQERVAIMCAEFLPNHGHRSLVSDYLALKSVNIIHLVSAVDVKEHCLSGE